jgi:hypothetical protein
MEEVPGLQFRSHDESINSLYRWYSDRKAEIDPEKLHFDDPCFRTITACQMRHP